MDHQDEEEIADPAAKYHHLNAESLVWNKGERLL